MRLSAHCHALAGFAYVPPWSVNAGFVWGDRRTLIVDPGPSAQAAATILGYAQTARPGNETLAIDTEPHLDHLAGNAFLRARGIDVYGHPAIERSDADLAADVAGLCASVGDRSRAAEAEIPFAGTRIANPNRAIDHEQTLDLGGVGAEVLLVPGHTPANLAVWVAAERVVYVGDTVVSDYRPNLASGGPADWRSWLVALGRIEALRPEVLVPGHGRILRGPDEIAREVARVAACLRQALG